MKLPLMQRLLSMHANHSSRLDIGPGRQKKFALPNRAVRAFGAGRQPVTIAEWSACFGSLIARFIPVLRNRTMSNLTPAPLVASRRPNRNGHGRILGLLAIAMLMVGQSLLAPAASWGQIAVRARMLHTMAGAPIADGVVLIQDGKITAVGQANQIAVPESYLVLEAAVVTPGLIDAHGTAGLTGIYNQPHDQDQQDKGGAIQPELRAIDAVNVREELLDYLRSFGITTLHTGHAPGELMSGQTTILKNLGGSIEDAVLVETASVLATIGPLSTRASGSPGTRGKQMAMLRQELVKAREYMQKLDAAAAPAGAAEAGRENPPAAAGGEAVGQDESGPDDRKSPEPPARDLRLESLVRVLRGEVPLLVTANRAQDIATALRLAKEFGFRLWLDGAAEAYLMTDPIREAGVPVFLHPSMIRANGDYENLSFETAAQLKAAGIPVLMQSGFEGYVPKTRVVLFEAALTAANGLSFEQALATITSEPARVLGISDRVGTLEVGKDADLALFDGDPFEYTTHCVGTLINGVVVSAEKR